MLYLDNNATTIMPEEVVRAMIEWTNKGNPSASYRTAEESRAHMKEFRKYIAKTCGFTSYEPDETYSDMSNVYQIIFTSGASESNNTIIRSVTTSYRFHGKKVPHIVTSSIEHKSLLDCVKQLARLGLIELTLLQPDALGFINPDKVAQAIKPNTCLISIMSANNETGAINNIRRIGEIAHSKQVPFHTDAVQTFGKFLLDPIKSSVDAFSVSFHKLHGPTGIGLLVIKKQFIDGFKLLPEICGSQNCGFRGGTENMPAIAASYAATKYTWSNRVQKNEKLAKMKRSFIALLARKMPTQTYREYLEKPSKHPVQVVIISTTEAVYLPNTILMSVIKRTGKPFCNVDLKKCLADNSVIVSIGSACNTASSKASHVLTEMKISDVMKRGTIRVSLGDDNTPDQMTKAVDILVKCIKEQTTDVSVADVMA